MGGGILDKNPLLGEGMDILQNHTFYLIILDFLWSDTCKWPTTTVFYLSNFISTMNSLYF